MIARNNHHRGLTRRWEEPSTASIPEGLWDTMFLDWEQMSLSYELGPIDCDIFQITLPFADLKRAFGLKPIELDAEPSGDPDRLSVREQHSLMKLVAGISVAKYAYDPRDLRTKSTAEIVKNLDLVGISMSKDTVRKLLRKASKHIPNGGTSES